VEIHVAVKIQAGVEKAPERRDAGLVKRQAVLRKKRVVAQARHIDHVQRKAGHVGVALNIVQVIDRVDAGKQLAQPDQPARLTGRLFFRHFDQEGHLPRIEFFPAGERPGRTAGNFRKERPQLLHDDQPAHVLVGQRPAGKIMLIKKMAEGSVPHVVQQTREPEQLLDVMHRRRIPAHLFEAGIKMPRKFSGNMHGAQRMLKAGVLRRRINPAGALQLVNAPEPLHPGRVKNVLFRFFLGV